MTAPDGSVVVLGYRLPVQYALDGLVLGGPIDGLGCWWIVQKTTGWHGGAKPKSMRTPRPYGVGSFRSANYRGERNINLTGQCIAVDTPSRLAGQDAFAALCSDPGIEYPLVVTDQAGRQRMAFVELDDAEDPVVLDERRFAFNLQLAARDPRKHAYQVQAPTAGPPVSSSTGVDFSSGSGLDFTAPGLDFGSPAIPQPLSVGNYGTAPGSPIIQIFGPAVAPTVNCLTSGYQFTYSGAIADGETVTINCDVFDREGFPPRRAISSVHGDVRSLLTINGWPEIDPGALETFTLQATSTPTTTLKVIFRSCWW